MAEDGGLPGKVARYVVAGIGPIASAGAQFALSLVLLRVLPPAQFGSFSFLLVASQLSWGLWSALFCAPLPILFARSDEDARQALLKTLLATNLIVAAGAAIVFFVIASALGVPIVGSAFFAAYAAIALPRWFARAHAYTIGRPLRTMASDLAYSATLLVATALVALNDSISLDLVYALLFVSAVLGLVPFGKTYLMRQFVRIETGAIRRYGAIWREHSRWSLVGVVTTDTTANSHAYIVTAVMGPSAFAPIAASALMIRPISVAMNALVEFERAQMAREIGARRFDAAIAAVRFFRWVMVLVWLVTAAAAVALLTLNPRLLFPPQYDLGFLTAGAALWMAVACLRLIRAPESALLQAAGAFRPLAQASMISCGVSVVAVVALLMTGGPLWSILGIFCGEAVFASWTWVQAHRWRLAQTGASGPVAGQLPAAAGH